MSRDHSQNHYGPNASFDGYDSDLASAGILIDSLQQQLAAAIAACKQKDAALEETRRELDACQKVIWLASDYGFDPAYVNGAKAAIASAEKALSIRF